MSMRSSKSDKITLFVMYSLVILFALICLYPMLMAVAVSFSDEQTVTLNGFKLIPEKFSLFTYQYFLRDKGMQLLNAYGVTIFVLVAGTLCSLFTTVTYAYASSVKGFRGANVLSFFAFFTMLFSGGMLPWYIFCTKYYGLTNSLFALFIPSAMNVFNMYLMKNFFKTIPVEISESAKVDGAGQLTIFVKLMLPLAKVGIVTITMYYALAFWNDWYLALMLINDDRFYPVQYLLYNMMQTAQFIASGANTSMSEHVTVPMQTARMAMTCIAIGPVILVYPLVQKYFVKGVTLGAVKG